MADNIISLGEAKRVVERTAHNKMVLERVQGVPAQKGTPESDADHRNPQPREVSMDGLTGSMVKAAHEKVTRDCQMEQTRSEWKRAHDACLRVRDLGDAINAIRKHDGDLVAAECLAQAMDAIK